jgi:5-(carboxyamino)imidazole ribonucleotide synthase
VLAVLGGGQLGRMLALAGIGLGVDFRFLDPSPDAPAAAVGPVREGALDDAAAMLRVARGSDAVTYEWEGFAATAVRRLEERGHVVRPPWRAVEIAQDRLREKEHFRSLGIEVAPYAPVPDRAGLDAAVDALGVPAVLKTRRGGYDGKGQVLVRTRDDVGHAWESLAAAGPLVLETFVPFDRELSVLGVRGENGDVRCWPPVENHHDRGILRWSRAPAPDSDAVRHLAEDAVRRLLDDLDYVGVLALELFQVGERVLVNEMAPRVHNSGHWTIEGAVTSQFENHVRAVLGWPLGATDAVGESAMVNSIGAIPDPAAVLGVAGAHLHRYGKAVRPGRKVGHVTVVAPTAAELDARLAALRAVLPADDG